MLQLTEENTQKIIAYYQQLDTDTQYSLYMQASKEPKEVIERLLEAA